MLLIRSSMLNISAAETVSERNTILSCFISRAPLYDLLTVSATLRAKLLSWLSVLSADFTTAIMFSPILASTALPSLIRIAFTIEFIGGTL